MTDPTSTIWLTQEAFDKLRNEYQHLIGPGRQEVTAKIARARDEGDLSENAGYHAAREEQGHQEARIRVLQQMLEQAQIGEPPAAGDTVAPGLRVTVSYDGDPDDTDTFVLGSREMLATDDSLDIEVYSPQSPLGQAVIGRKVGESVTYPAPNGNPINVTIESVDSM